MNKILENLRKIRVIHNYSQEYIASQLNIDPSTYNNVENGKANLTMKRFEKICTIFNMSMVEVLQFSAGSDNVANELPSEYLRMQTQYKDFEKKAEEWKNKYYECLDENRELLRAKSK